MRLLPLFMALACTPVAEKDDHSDGPDDTADTGVPDDSGDSGDSEEPIVDEDNDGYMSDVDCDDNDYQVYPEAPEVCDGVDNDCDESADEDFDVDQDGHYDVTACADGDDCDDADPTAYTGAPEIAYDDIDQDCDGADLLDGDGDGYDVRFDCDDEDATAHPDGIEVPKNGIDEDCDGTDDLDEDDDGSDDEDWGGNDCDDADPAVHPDARDWMGDSFDADCDGADGLPYLAADAGVTITGTSGSPDLVGEGVAICDLDGDGWDDLIVTAPFYDGYAGALGIWYGDGSASWAAGMTMSSADTFIESTSMFLGFEVACADLDGDGNLDLATGRGEIAYPPTYVTQFGLVLWYGAGGKWAATLDESDGVELSLRLGATRGETNVYGRNLTAGDIDGDGAAEILFDNDADANLSEAEGDLWIVPGALYTGAAQLEDIVEIRITPDSLGATTRVHVLADPEGDGDNLFIGQGLYTTDTADTGTVYPGRASWATTPDETGLTVADWAWATLEGDGDGAFGWDLVVGDFDGDGLDDAVIAAVTDATTAADGGGIYALGGIAAELVGIGVDGPSLADAHLAGETEEGYFGWAVQSGGDLDGDGAADLLVSEPGGSSASGQVWLFSGARLFSGSSLDDAALGRWGGEAVDSSLANAMAVGDLDGDGEGDLVFAAYAQADDGDNPNGRVYVWLSGS